MADATEYWRALPREDLYWAVLTRADLAGKVPEGETREAFFETGEANVSQVLDTIRRVFYAGFAPASVLDFGCGVGRLLPAFATRIDRVVGLDASEAMLSEAQRVIAERVEARDPAQPEAGVELLTPERFFARPAERFELVHSVLVLQHIRNREGLEWIDQLAGLTRPGGCFVFQFCYRPPMDVVGSLIYRLVGCARRLRRRFIRGMEMHEYELTAVLAVLRSRGFSEFHMASGDQPGHRGLTIYARHGGA